MHGALLVQLSGYGTDNSVLVDAMQRHPHRFKAIGVVHADVRDPELENLISAGLVGVRFNLVSYDRDALGPAGESAPAGAIARVRPVCPSLRPR